ncbi:glycoside hydrolase superfamily [Chytriomyces sp. MP71]|nr:glycoside hydrolase superfamily [Chytriomyces sp. MP71]
MHIKTILATVSLVTFVRADSCFPAWDAGQAVNGYPSGSKVSDKGQNWVANWWSSQQPSSSGDGSWANKGVCDGSTPPPPPSDCFPAWDATKAANGYSKGAQVSDAGFNWVANWWANKEPSATADGSWSKIGPCGAPAVSSSVPTQPSSSSAAPPLTTSVVPPPPSSSSVVKPTTTSFKPASSSLQPVTTSVKPVTSASSAAPVTTATSSLPLCYPKWNAAYTYTKDSFASTNGHNYVSKYQGAASPPADQWTDLGPCDTSAYNFRPFTTPGLIGYWTQWSFYSRAQNMMQKLDLSGFSAVNYAFLDVDANGNLVSFDSYADGINIPILNGEVRVKYPNLRTVISVGGWSGSRFFSDVFADAGKTAAFVKNVHKYLDDNGFDGVDIDYEYPGGGGTSCNHVSPNDAANFASALAALRAELGPNRSISLAVSAEVSHYISNGKQYIPDIAKVVDYIQIMSYDFYGSWSPYSDFNSPLNSPGASDPQEPTVNNNGYSQPLSQVNAVNAWAAAGAPLSKLTSGLAFYGRSWSVQSAQNNGLYQLCTGSNNGASCAGIVGDYLDQALYCDKCNTCYHAGVWMYNNLRGASNTNQQGGVTGQQANAPLAGASATTASNGWTRQYYNFAESPTLYTTNYNNQPTFISYDDPVSIKAKAAWAKAKGLGGAMIWELSQDYNTEMINAARAGWGA